MIDKATPVPVRTAAPRPAALRRRDWPSFADLRRELDALFDDVTRDWFGAPMRVDTEGAGLSAGGLIEPAVDVVETDAAFVLTGELPGIDVKDLVVEVAGDRLTIRGEKTDRRDETDKGRRVTERRYGAFERSFLMPDGIDRDAVAAAYDAGLLTITMPKTAEARVEPRRIAVKAA